MIMFTFIPDFIQKIDIQLKNNCFRFFLVVITGKYTMSHFFPNYANVWESISLFVASSDGFSDVNWECAVCFP